MKLSDFNYSLPKELIAQEPIKKREQSRLMVLKENRIIHDRFYNLTNYLKKDDVLVINETKVLKNKITGKKETGAKAEVILEEDVGNNIYKTRIKTNNPRVGNRLIFKDNLSGEIIKTEEDGFIINFNKKPDLEKIGELPLPFYVKKELKKQERYQTVFAKKKGSLAAPTASLHFTNSLIKKIKKKGVKIAKVCLHISFGTFLPIRTDDFAKHKMHEEYYEIDEKTASIINNCKGSLVCVGTTTVRAIESAASQKGEVLPRKAKTDLFIYPGYNFKTKISAIVTNFHLPKSSLLLLVCGFYNREKVLKAYNEAIHRMYRFYSFGDAMLLVR